MSVGLPLIIDSVNYQDKKKGVGKKEHKVRGPSPSTAQKAV